MVSATCASESDFNTAGVSGSVSLGLNSGSLGVGQGCAEVYSNPQKVGNRIKAK